MKTYYNIIKKLCYLLLLTCFHKKFYKQNVNNEDIHSIITTI